MQETSRDEARSRLIFAVDYPDIAAAEAATAQLHERVGVLKVGLQLFIQDGSRALDLAREATPLFLDLKLHDIPATVGRAVASARRIAAGRVQLLTVHAGGGKAMLQEAVEQAGSDFDIVAVTVLSSLGDDDLRALGVADSTGDQARRLASLAWQAGVRTFVCSPHEAPLLRRELGHEARLITPGVRPAGSATHDQKRVTTPAQAIAGGAHQLVVGRPIRDAVDPAAAADSIVAEIAKALTP